MAEIARTVQAHAVADSAPHSLGFLGKSLNLSGLLFCLLESERIKRGSLPSDLLPGFPGFLSSALDRYSHIQWAEYHPLLIPQRYIELFCVLGLALESVSAQALPFDSGTQAGKSVETHDVKSYRRVSVREKGHLMLQRPGRGVRAGEQGQLV